MWVHDPLSLRLANAISLIPHPHTILQHRRAVFIDRHLELRGERGGLREFVRRADHLPISANWFVYLNSDGRVLVIPQRDLVLEFVEAVGELLIIGLFALGDDVKRVADVQADGFVLGSVVDAVFADKQRAAAGVGLIHADRARWQWHSESSLVFVLEFVKDLHGVLHGRSGLCGGAVIVGLPVHHVYLLERKARSVQQADLFRFLVENRRSATEV